MCSVLCFNFCDIGDQSYYKTWSHQKSMAIFFPVDCCFTLVIYNGPFRADWFINERRQPFSRSTFHIHDDLLVLSADVEIWSDRYRCLDFYFFNQFVSYCWELLNVMDYWWSLKQGDFIELKYFGSHDYTLL